MAAEILGKPRHRKHCAARTVLKRRARRGVGAIRAAHDRAPVHGPQRFVDGYHVALPEYRSASRAVMVGIARSVGALAGIHDQLWIGRRADRGYASTHPRCHRSIRYGQSPLVPLYFVAPAAIRLRPRNGATTAR